MCQIAVQKDGLNLQYVPLKYKTLKMYKLAIQTSNRMALWYIQEQYITPELCVYAIRENGLILQYVPTKYKTFELINMALQNNGLPI